MKYIYIILTILGAIIPLTEFISFINENGLNFSILIKQAFENHISAFAWLDVIITVIVIVVMTIDFSKKSEVKNIWIPILASLTVGASFGLPLLMFMRELQLEKTNYPHNPL